MGLLSKIREIDHKFAWSFVGVVLAIGFGILSLYTAFFYQKKPHLTLDVIGYSTVLDVPEDLRELAITYRGINITKQNECLQVITVRLTNDGNVDILKTFYDDTDPVGFDIIAGKIAQPPELMHASNEYLRRHLKVALSEPGRVTISPIILEAGHNFVLTVLVLSPRGSKVLVTPIGKVAGVPDIELGKSFLDIGKKSFTSAAFGGTASVQMVRIVVYSIVGVGVVVLLTLADLLLERTWERRKRKAALRRYGKARGIDVWDDKFRVLHPFLKWGRAYILTAAKLNSEEEFRNKVFGWLQKPDLKSPHISINEKFAGSLSAADSESCIRDLLTSGLVTNHDAEYCVDPASCKHVMDFLEFLQSKAIVPQGMTVHLYLL
jgi:hypothetical protein